MRKITIPATLRKAGQMRVKSNPISHKVAHNRHGVGSPTAVEKLFRTQGIAHVKVTYWIRLVY